VAAPPQRTLRLFGRPDVARLVNSVNGVLVNKRIGLNSAGDYAAVHLKSVSSRNSWATSFDMQLIATWLHRVHESTRRIVVRTRGWVRLAKVHRRLMHTKLEIEDGPPSPDDSIVLYLIPG